ncbi:unnamed protein product [Malus baccata var. baccata]
MTDSNLELQESGWEELRREARKIEGDLDVKLSSYAKLGARFTQGGYVDSGSPPVSSSRSWKSMEMEIESLLEKLLDINDSMSRCAASATPATSVTQKLARHRDILHEFTQEFRRIKGNINSLREHAELLTSVRDDISEYKVCFTSPHAGIGEYVTKNANTTGESCHPRKCISCKFKCYLVIITC